MSTETPGSGSCGQSSSEIRTERTPPTGSITARPKARPADLGYYVGYKICEAYYQAARDKKQAVKDILEMKDFNEFLKDSGYEQKVG
jgi:hypothetical protein